MFKKFLGAHVRRPHSECVRGYMPPVPPRAAIGSSSLHLSVLLVICLYLPSIRLMLVSVLQACRAGRMQIVDQLVYYGADVNSRNYVGNTPLHICAIYDQVINKQAHQSNE